MLAATGAVGAATCVVLAATTVAAAGAVPAATGAASGNAVLSAACEGLAAECAEVGIGMATVGHRPGPTLLALPGAYRSWPAAAACYTESTCPTHLMYPIVGGWACVGGGMT